MSERPRVFPYGESAYYVDLGAGSSPDRASRTHAAGDALRAALPESDVVVGGGVIAIVNAPRSADTEATIAAAISASAEMVHAGKTHEIPVVYDGPDLEEAARALGLSTSELVRMHSEREVGVELVGFLPGFAYMGPIDERIVLPRKTSPRPRVPAGSLGIAGAFTGIYPFDSPGGWNLLGRAPSIALFDPDRDPPILLAPGDRARFSPIDAKDAPPAPRVEKPIVTDMHSKRALVVEAAPPCATVQDAGRAGQLSRGLPPSGPLDPETHAAANEAVGNPSGAAAIEVPLGALSVVARGEVVVSIDGEAPVRLADGERIVVPESTHAVRYIAARGGIDVPLALGARSTLLVARLGGLGGRPLRRRDVLPVGDPGASSSSKYQWKVSPNDGEVATILVDEGPHADRFPKGAWDALLSETFVCSRLGDRVGRRLEGAKIPREGPDLALPSPMVRGAVQVATDGTPIVLGPDHPTTGGYPVLAVVHRTSFGALARRKPGDRVRFRAGWNRLMRS